MTDLPVDLDKRRGIATQKATDLRRALADVEANLRELREREADLESRMMTVPPASWPEAAVKARHLLNLYAASLLAEMRAIAHRWHRCSTISPTVDRDRNHVTD
ncbi:hypothetical protein SAMN05216525_10168 [Bradyrhizobium sp. Gha]|nr:hypothetical protein SAMN05216525_10168 [Bradyrhizobium sp. Gha]